MENETTAQEWSALIQKLEAQTQFAYLMRKRALARARQDDGDLSVIFLDGIALKGLQ